MNLSPFISKILYAMLLSPLQLEQSSAPRRFALSRQQSSYARTISIIKLVDRVIPGYAHRLSHLMYRKNRFPWAPVGTELIAYGSGTAVFKMNWKNGKKVLRVYRKSLGKSLPETQEIARHYKRNYDTVRAWYGGQFKLVLPMDFLILYGLPFSDPIAGSLQPYVHGQKQDLFQDFTNDEILQLLKRNGFMRNQFNFFARQTIRQWSEQETCFDFVGRENLMLVEDGGDYRLCIVDVGIFNFDLIAIKYPQKMDQIKQRMERLLHLYESAKSI